MLFGFHFAQGFCPCCRGEVVVDVRRGVRFQGAAVACGEAWVVEAC